MEESKEAAEAVSAPYFQWMKHQYIKCNIITLCIVLVIVEAYREKANKIFESILKTPV